MPVESEDLVTGVERGGSVSDTVHLPREHHAEYGLPGRRPAESEPRHQAVCEVQIQSPDVGVARSDRCGPDAYSHLATSRNRNREIDELQHVRRPVSHADDGFHPGSPSSRTAPSAQQPVCRRPSRSTRPGARRSREANARVRWGEAAGMRAPAGQDGRFFPMCLRGHGRYLRRALGWAGLSQPSEAMRSRGRPSRHASLSASQCRPVTPRARESPGVTTRSLAGCLHEAISEGSRHGPRDAKRPARERGTHWLTAAGSNR